jgi:hypothetical protein
MTDLTGQVVDFHLSPHGRRALKGLVPVRGPLQALVVGTDEMGALVHSPAAGFRGETDEGITVMLLRWDYITTMIFAFQIEGGFTRPPIGFRGI